ncbi:MAG: N-formylglutamate amidohydrolase [Alphaproteobacteria bacterium]|nr:N-formylglutamate amidohydrolase [Alphaproteobacteria bacterium]
MARQQGEGRSTARRECPPFEVRQPATWTSPVVYAVPHSGTYYPSDLVLASALDRLTLRKSEDAFVDELFLPAILTGSPLIKVNYARVYLDVNREPYELDPQMFEDPLPPEANTTSLRVAGGLGTIARVVADGAEVYRSKLKFEAAEERVARIYRPYHEALAELLRAARARFGFAVLIDCHSMPSMGAMQGDGRRRADVVLGDRFGTSCATLLSDLAETLLRAEKLAVARNNPYAGGFTTYHYGRPAEGVHALQIELNRALYMDEERIAKRADFAALAASLRRVIAGLSGLSAEPAGRV